LCKMVRYGRSRSSKLVPIFHCIVTIHCVPKKIGPLSKVQ